MIWLMPRKSGIDWLESLYHVYRLGLGVLWITAACPYSLSEQRKGKKKPLQVMKYEDLLNRKNKCFRKYCSAKLNWRGFWNDHYLWRPEKVTWLIPFSIFHATRSDTKARLSPHKGPGRGEKVHAAICVKKAGSITNLGSREGQVEHGEVIIYCASTHIMEHGSVCRGSRYSGADSGGKGSFYGEHKRNHTELHYTWSRLALYATTHTQLDTLLLGMVAFKAQCIYFCKRFCVFWAYLSTRNLQNWSNCLAE